MQERKVDFKVSLINSAKDPQGNYVEEPVRHFHFDKFNVEEMMLLYRSQREDEEMLPATLGAREMSATINRDYPVPSRSCFLDVAEFAWASPYGGAKYVHGLIVSKDSNLRFEHAWVETGRNVVECRWLNGTLYWALLSSRLFHRKTQVLKKKVYTRQQLVRLMDEHEHAGPWEPWMLLGIDDEIEKRKMGVDVRAMDRQHLYGG